MKLLPLTSLFILFSCHSTDEKNSEAKINTAIKTNTYNNTAGDVEARKKVLNEKSNACIALMDKLEDEQHTVMLSGDMKKSGAIQLRIDSSAEENGRIGQQLMTLEK